MNNCTEFILDDAMAITAIPVTDFTPGTADWQSKAVIDSGSFSPSLTNAVTIGLQSVSPGGALVPIRRTTGKAKDDEGDSVAGRLHTVTVNCEVDERGGEIWEHQLALERSASHLLLTFRDGSRAFVAATEDTYVCNVERDGAKVTVAFRIQNLMGVQQLVQSAS